MDGKLPGCVVGRGYPDRLQQSGCGEDEKMATCQPKRSLIYGVLALTAAVLVGVMQLEAAEPTTQPAKPLPAQKLLVKASSAVVRIHAYSPEGKEIARGLGFLIDTNGTVVTNHHVVKGASSARLFVGSGLVLPVVSIIAADTRGDVAIIKVKGKGLPFLTLRTDEPKVGEKVYALVSSSGRKHTLGFGAVTGLRVQEEVAIVGLSGSISRGPSGRALLDSGGRVLGMGIEASGAPKGQTPGLVVTSKRMASFVKSVASSTPTEVKLAPPPAVVKTPKIYASLSALLSQIPRKLTIGTDRELSTSQKSRVNQWLGENVPRGSMITHAGRFSGASVGSSDIALTFRYAVVSIHGKRIMLRVTANLDLEFAEKVKTLKSGAPPAHYTVGGIKTSGGRGKLGTPITVHGKIAQVAIVNGELRVCLTDGGFGKIPPPKRPITTVTPKPKPKLAPKSPEKKAEGKFKLAKMYLAVGKKVKAVEILKGIIADYPDTDAAKAAAKKLKEF